MKARYVRAAVVPLAAGLEAIKSNNERMELAGYEVGVCSLRLRTFEKKGTCCAYCGLEATHFAIEKCQGSKLDIYHMNLWGMRDGAEILFTHDHVHARGLGGADNLKNSVTACESCNNKKSKYETRVLNYIRNAKIKTQTLTALIDIVKIMYPDNATAKRLFSY